MPTARHPLLLAALLALAPAADARAGMLLSQGKPTSGTGFYDAGSETFPFDNVNDGRFDDTGTPGDWSFWLTRNGLVDSVTIDLQGVFAIDRFVVENTRNRGFKDRGTNGFVIGVSSDNVTFTPVVVGNLANVWGTGDNIPTEEFTPSSPVTGRYVRFGVTSFYGSGGGLNELQVFGGPAASAVPEPASLGLLAAGGLGLVGARLRRRGRAG